MTAVNASPRTAVGSTRRRCHAEPVSTVSLGVLADLERVSEASGTRDTEPEQSAAPGGVVQLDAETGPRSADVEAGCADEPSHDAEPDPDRKRAQESGKARHTQCSHCGSSFGRPSRSHRRFCSGRCQRAAHRARRGGAP